MYSNQILTTLRWFFIRKGPLTLAIAILLFAQQIYAGVPTGFKQSVVAKNLVSPTRIAIAPDGRIFIAEQPGRIRIIEKGQLLARPFLNITTRVNSQGERGLLGIAFDPDFLVNQWVYVYYTSKYPVVHNRVSRFKANGDIALTGSEDVLLDIQPSGSQTLHNGGAIGFGGDGRLYIAVGDGGIKTNAQSLGNLKGKMLRINKDGSIPTDNPFYNSASGVNRAIWVKGLRNPYNFDVQPGSGRIYANDVGENSWEEVNQIVKGSNYGWPIKEGRSTDTRFRNPIIAYAHAANVPCSAIIGSAFYNPIKDNFPSHFVGDYFYGDFCGGWIRRYDIATRKTFSLATGMGQIIDLQVSVDGVLYVLRKDGQLHSITH